MKKMKKYHQKTKLIKTFEVINAIAYEKKSIFQKHNILGV